MITLAGISLPIILVFAIKYFHIKSKWKRIASLILLSCLLITSVCTELIMIYASTYRFYSYTESIENYRVFDDTQNYGNLFNNFISINVMPDKIPESASNIKYQYKYKESWGEPSAYVYGSWVLPKEIYDETKTQTVKEWRSKKYNKENIDKNKKLSVLYYADEYTISNNSKIIDFDNPPNIMTTILFFDDEQRVVYFYYFNNTKSYLVDIRKVIENGIN